VYNLLHNAPRLEVLCIGACEQSLDWRKQKATPYTFPAHPRAKAKAAAGAEAEAGAGAGAGAGAEEERQTVSLKELHLRFRSVSDAFLVQLVDANPLLVSAMHFMLQQRCV
jgi:hypothetical protein